MTSSLRSLISFCRRSTFGSNPAVAGGVPPILHQEMMKATATAPAQVIVERSPVTISHCCHDSCDEANPARTRFTQLRSRLLVALQSVAVTAVSPPALLLGIERPPMLSRVHDRAMGGIGDG